MSDTIIQHLLSVIALWSYKIVTLIIGYMFAKLGYNLLLKGITGEFKFSTELRGAKADLVSASPGTFFILVGTIIVGIGIYKGMLIDSIPSQQNEEICHHNNKPTNENINKPYLPKVPPTKEADHVPK